MKKLLCTALAIALLTLAWLPATYAQAVEVQAGDVVTFGTFYRKVGEETETQAYPWIVLEIKDDVAFLLSKYIIRGVFYSYDDGVNPYSERIATKWEYSAIRKWLSTDETTVVNSRGTEVPGFKTYFTDAQWEAIVPTAIDDGDKSLVDKVFLLSVEDAANPAYFGEDADRTATHFPGTYSAAYKPGGYGGSYDYGRCEWWLRTKYADSEWNLDSVYIDGRISHARNNKGIGVRPAMYVPLSAIANADGGTGADGAAQGTASFTVRTSQFDAEAYAKLHASVGSGLSNGYNDNSGNCTWYALARALEIQAECEAAPMPLVMRPETGRNTFQGNAGHWYADNAFLNERGMGYQSSSTTPVAGSIAVWRVVGEGGQADSNGHGHVAIVESVQGDQVTLTEGNYGVFDQETKTLRYNYAWETKTMTVDALAHRTGFGALQGFIYVLEPYSAK